MYIRYNADTKVVIYIGEIERRSTDSLLAEYNGEIPKNDWLTVANVEQKTRVLKEAYDETIEFDENGEPLKELQTIHHEAVTENYLECTELTPHFRVYTEEETTQQKQAKYESLVKKYIREKYSADDVEAILANYLDGSNDAEHIEEHKQFQEYRKFCKARAKAELDSI
jgi:hypothetical protein